MYSLLGTTDRTVNKFKEVNFFLTNHEIRIE